MPGMYVVHMHTCRQNTHIQSEKPEENNNRNSTINNAIIIYHLIFYSYRSILISKVMVSKKKS